MNWYRVTFQVNGRRKVAEVQAHNASDSMLAAASKLGLMGVTEYDNLKAVGFECIDVPEWARGAIEAAEHATRPADDASKP